MSTGRLQGFSDAVIAVIITILVLELRAPQGSDFTALQPLVTSFLIYVFTFFTIAIY